MKGIVMANPKVTVIQAKPKYSGAIRTAIYCRVSSTKKPQMESLIAQISALTNLVAYLPGYVLFDTYIDIASGETLTGRPEFQRLIKDCQSGKIKQVITKSASRFGRDIVITMTAIHQLKLCGVKIYFEQEGIDSDNPNLQVELAAHLAFAQQDNYSRSDNISWGIRAGAQLGTSKIYDKICYGYKHNKEGKLIINEKEAENVRLIFRLYLDGNSVLGIISYLKRHKIKSPTGKENWNKRYIEKMLRNGKYAGDAFVQLEEGTYMIKDHHPAIIARESFDAIQAQLAMRSNIIENPDGTITRKGSKYSGKKVIRETRDIIQTQIDLGLDKIIYPDKMR